MGPRDLSQDIIKVLMVWGYGYRRGFVFDQVSMLARRGVRIHVARKVGSIRNKRRDLIVNGMCVHNFPRKIDLSMIPIGAKSVGKFPFKAFFHPRSIAATVPYSWFVAKLAKMYKINLIHAYFALPEGFAGLLAKNVVKKPLVISVLGYDVQLDRSTGYGALLRKWDAEMVSKALNGADAIIVGDRSHMSKVLNLLGKDESDKVFFVLPAIDVNRFNPFLNGHIVREKFNIGSDQTLILFARRLDPIYGAEHLIKAASQIVMDHPKTVFLMAGAGPVGPLQALVRKLDLAENVIFVGEVPRSELPYYYVASDIFCDPCAMGQGIASMEALACGRPVVGFKTGQTKIVDRVDGFLVETADVDELAIGLSWLVEHPDARKKMGMKGRERIEKHHALGNRVDEILKIYNKLCISS